MAMLDEAQREPTPETRVSRYLAINMERFARIERGEETAFAVLSELRAMEEPYRDPLLAGWREVFRKTRALSGAQTATARPDLFGALAHGLLPNTSVLPVLLLLHALEHYTSHSHASRAVDMYTRA